MVADEAGLQTASLLDNAGVVDKNKPVIQQEEGHRSILKCIHFVL